MPEKGPLFPLLIRALLLRLCRIDSLARGNEQPRLKIVAPKTSIFMEFARLVCLWVKTSSVADWYTLEIESCVTFKKFPMLTSHCY